MNRLHRHKLMRKGGAEMDTKGLWELFFETGHPAVWLAIRQENEPLNREEQSDAHGYQCPGAAGSEL